MVKKTGTSSARQKKINVDYGVSKDRIPKDWIETRELMERRGWSVFSVKKWYYMVMVVIALILFTIGFIQRNLEISAAAFALTLILYYWNKRAKEANLE